MTTLLTRQVQEGRQLLRDLLEAPSSSRHSRRTGAAAIASAGCCRSASYWLAPWQLIWRPCHLPVGTKSSPGSSKSRVCTKPYLSSYRASASPRGCLRHCLDLRAQKFGEDGLRLGILRYVRGNHVWADENLQLFLQGPRVSLHLVSPDTCI